MAKKSRPPGKGEAKGALKEEPKVTVIEESKESVKEETIVSVKDGGIINFYYFFSGIGIVIGMIFIIYAVFHYMLHIF